MTPAMWEVQVARMDEHRARRGVPPLAEVMTLPGLPMKSAEHGSEVLWKLYEKFPAIQREFSAIQQLILYTTHPYFIFTSKKQVKTLDDLKGMKIRVIGGPATDQMKEERFVSLMREDECASKMKSGRKPSIRPIRV